MTRRRLILFKIATPILILVLAELALRYLFDARFRLDLAERQTLAAYQGKPWARQYFKDLWSCAGQSARAHQPRYVRYVLQDINEDCTTQTVNYANRIRKTWNPDGPAWRGRVRDRDVRRLDDGRAGRDRRRDDRLSVLASRERRPVATSRITSPTTA